MCPNTGTIYLTSLTINIATSKGHLTLIHQASTFRRTNQTKERGKGWNGNKYGGTGEKTVCDQRGSHSIKLLTLLWPVMAFTIATMPNRSMLIM